MNVAFLDAQPPEEPPAGSDVESRCSRATKGDEEAEGFLRSETEPSEVQDQVDLPAGAEHDGHQSDDEEADGDQSTNRGQSKESATCQQVVKLFTDVTDSLEVRNAAFPADIQANKQSLGSTLMGTTMGWKLQCQFCCSQWQHKALL